MRLLKPKVIFSLITSILMLVMTLFYLSEYGDNSLKPFTSDGCSAFPEGTLAQNNLWLECCTAHDYAYWKGGTYNQRMQADKELKHCVEKAGQPEIALLMLAGVRVGGTPFFPTSFRWGYGWTYPKFYGQLTHNELKQIKIIEKQPLTLDKNNLITP